ncbi:hypothetical protein A2U01_0036675 [Trifolium medium]|uniref:Uncharacterized protein n=1 Tax=Trifolium medium TaxID=97028 RepID=A0A392PV44_9FABA|nr:hypothetical protein [Trifolium medium]
MNDLFETRDLAASESQERNETGCPSQQVEGEDNEEVPPNLPPKRRKDPVLKVNDVPTSLLATAMVENDVERTAMVENDVEPTTENDVEDGDGG